MSEKRKFMRFDVAVEVEYMVPGNGAPIEGISVTRNLSREGMQITVNSKLVPGTELEIKLRIPEDMAPVYAKGDLVWVEKSEIKTESSAGVKFSQMSPFDRNRILDHVYKEWVEEQIGQNAAQPRNK
ncbi:MAG: PilZ domain-containing protein [Candidatus Omnitrophota bacterium]|jgi:c-di-GMP-binding flagellar brake protein YcgR